MLVVELVDVDDICELVMFNAMSSLFYISWYGCVRGSVRNNVVL